MHDIPEDFNVFDFVKNELKCTNVKHFYSFFQYLKPYDMMNRLGPETYKKTWKLLLQWNILVDYLAMTEYYSESYQQNWQSTFQGLALFAAKKGRYYRNIFHHILYRCMTDNPISTKEFKRQYDASLPQFNVDTSFNYPGYSPPYAFRSPETANLTHPSERPTNPYMATLPNLPLHPNDLLYPEEGFFDGNMPKKGQGTQGMRKTRTMSLCHIGQNSPEICL